MKAMAESSIGIVSETPAAGDRWEGQHGEGRVFGDRGLRYAWAVRQGHCIVAPCIPGEN